MPTSSSISLSTSLTAGNTAVLDTVAKPRESIRRDSWFYQKKHPIAHYVLMIRLLDNKSHFQQVMDETTIHRNTVRRLWLSMCSSMQRVMDIMVYDTVPLFDCNEIVEIDEAYMH